MEYTYRLYPLSRYGLAVIESREGELNNYDYKILSSERLWLRHDIKPGVQPRTLEPDLAERIWNDKQLHVMIRSFPGMRTRSSLRLMDTGYPVQIIPKNKKGGRIVM